MKPVRRHALLVSLAALVLVACSTAATAAASPAGAAHAANLCTVGKGVVKSLTVPRSATAASTLQANVAKILAAKSALISASPAKLKTDMRTALSLLALFKADLAKVGGNFALVYSKPALAKPLVAAVTKDTPAINRINRYVKTTCHA